MKSEIELREATRGAYERGRIQRGARLALVVIPMSLLAYGCRASVAVTVLVAALLAACIVGFVWRGGLLARATEPGLVAGAIALVLPGLAGLSCHLAAPQDGLCWAACICGGICAGIALAVQARKIDAADKHAFVLASGTVAALAGALGCLFVGLGGAFAMLIALSLASAPALRLAQR